MAVELKKASTIGMDVVEKFPTPIQAKVVFMVEVWLFIGFRCLTILSIILLQFTIGRTQWSEPR